MEPTAPEIQMRIGDLIDQGNHKEAYDLSLSLAKAGVASAQMTLGWLYQVGKGVDRDFEQAKHWYRLATQSNSPRAEFYLGTVYWNESSFAQAVGWFEKAASNGFAAAAYQLARMYRHGIGVPLDQRLAREYVQQAARAGHVYARRDLAREMAKGRFGVSRIPLGLVRLAHVGWSAARIASRNMEDDLLLRL